MDFLITQEQILNARALEVQLPSYRIFYEGDKMGIECDCELSADQIEAICYEYALVQKESALQRRLKDIDQITDHILAQGFQSNALGTWHTYDLRIEDQINMSALIQAKIDSPFRCQEKGAPFKTYKLHTKEQLLKVFEDGLARKAKVLNFYGHQKELLHACKSLEEVLNFKIEDLEDG